MIKPTKRLLLKLSLFSLFFLHIVSDSRAQMAQPLGDFLDYDQTRINSFQKFYDWFDDITASLFVRNMQHSTSQRGDSKFYSFDVSPARNKEQIDLLGLGITVNLKPDGENTKAWRSISAQSQYKALAYLRHFDMQDLDPLDLKKLFRHGLDMLKMSPPEVAAHIVNTFYLDRFNDERFRGDNGDSEARVRYALQPLFDAIKRQYGVTIKEYPSQKALFEGYAQEIEMQTKQHYAEVIYDILIKGNTEEETEKHFNSFFRRPGLLAGDLLDMLTPEGKINFSDKIFSLDFDPKVFYRTDKEAKNIQTDEEVSLIPQYSTYKYEFGKNGWELILEFTSFGKKEDYYFLFTDFAKLNPPNFPNEYNPKTDMRHFVVAYDQIKKMRIVIGKDNVRGYLEYTDGINYYKFMDKKIPK